MNTTLDPNFLAATMLMTSYKGGHMRRAQGALLFLALTSRVPITAADLPGEITNGDTHLAGAATGALIALNLLAVVGRCKSPRPDAKGRKLNTLDIPLGRRGAARTWLQVNGCPQPELAQIEMAI